VQGRDGKKIPSKQIGRHIAMFGNAWQYNFSKETELLLNKKPPAKSFAAAFGQNQHVDAYAMPSDRSVG
jgi:hypothetical protein